MSTLAATYRRELADRQQRTLARCYVALAEMDYDLRAWGEEIYVRNVIDGSSGRLSDFDEVAA